MGQSGDTQRVGRFHPTQKPVELLKWLINTYSNAGDTVLDPVMGGGTTGVAAHELGRRFIGIEKNAEYFNTAYTRLGIRLEPAPDLELGVK